MKHLKYIFIAISLFSIASCTSFDRMLRISPFDNAKPAPDRVNLTPLVYHDSGKTAVLWPLMDFDPTGFTIRPLITHQDDYWAVLYPFAEWKNGGKGWAGPFYWNKAKEYKGCFPLYHLGDNFNFLGPIWWDKKRNGSLNQYGLFPLYTGGYFNNLGPFWWNSGQKTSGLFPLIWSYNEHKDFHLIPLYNHHLNGENYRLNFLLGLAHLEKENDARTNWLFPLWYSNTNKDKCSQLLFPFYLHNKTINGYHTRTLLGNWHKNPVSEGGNIYPLYFSKTTGDKQSTTLFPLFHHKKEGPNSSTHTLLANWYQQENASGLNIYPLWWSNKEDDQQTNMLLPFFYHRQNESSHTFLTPLFGKGWDNKDESKYLNILGPIYHHSEAATSTLTSFFWPFYMDNTTKDSHKRWLLPFFYANTSKNHRSLITPLWWSNKENDKKNTTLLPIYHRRDKGEEHSLYTALFSHSWNDSNVNSHTNILGLLFDKKTTDTGSSQSILWPLYHQSVNNDHSNSWCFPLWWKQNNNYSEKSFYSPLIYYEKEYDRKKILSPLGARSWNDTNDNGYTNILGPLYHQSVNDKQRSRAVLWPLYNHSEGEDYSTSWLLPFYLKNQHNGKKSIYSPLFQKQWNDHNDQGFFNSFPLYGQSKEEELTQNWLAAGLWHNQNKHNKYSCRLWPLASYSQHNQAPGFFYEFSLFKKIGNKNNSHFHIAGPLIYSSEKNHSKYHSSSKQRFLLFGKKNEEHHINEIPTANNKNAVTDSNTFSISLLFDMFDLFRYKKIMSRQWKPVELNDMEKNTLHSWSTSYNGEKNHDKKLWRDIPTIKTLLKKQGISTESDNVKEIQQAVLNFSHDHTIIKESYKNVYVPLIHEYKKTESRLEWDYLFYLINYEKDREKDISNFSILWKLYESKRIKDETTRNIFPFITYDNAPQKKKTKFSFLWRLIEYHRKDNKKGGHLFFIPWGSSEVF